jgi:hypothetical protein
VALAADYPEDAAGAGRDYEKVVVFRGTSSPIKKSMCEQHAGIKTVSYSFTARAKDDACALMRTCQGFGARIWSSLELSESHLHEFALPSIFFMKSEKSEVPNLIILKKKKKSLKSRQSSS